MTSVGGPTTEDGQLGWSRSVDIARGLHVRPASVVSLTCEARLAHLGRKVDVFGQESIAWMTGRRQNSPGQLECDTYTKSAWCCFAMSTMRVPSRYASLYAILSLVRQRNQGLECTMGPRRPSRRSGSTRRPLRSTLADCKGRRSGQRTLKMAGETVLLRINSHRRHARFFGRGDDSTGDFAAIGDEDCMVGHAAMRLVNE